MRTGLRQMILVALVAAVFSSPLIADPAHACSCAMPSDIAAWVDESEAAFVGTMIDKRDSGSGEFGQESIYTFEVEQWVKGDAGDVIEVSSASNGAACGFEFWNGDNRTGAILYEEGGELHGSLCAQVDADVLLAAMKGPTTSTTGVGHLLVAYAHGSTKLSLLDRSGGWIGDFYPTDEPANFESTQTFQACPGGEFAIQQTAFGIHVWDLRTIEVATTHSLDVDPNVEWIESASCLDAEAELIYAAVGSEFGRQLVDISTGATLGAFNGWVAQFTPDWVLFRRDATDELVLVSVADGTERLVREVPKEEIRGVYSSIHPSEPRMAVVETFYHGDGGAPDSVLTIETISGEEQVVYEIPGEAYQPIWIDDDRVLVRSLEWDASGPGVAIVFDVTTGEALVLEGWSAWDPVYRDGFIYGANGGEIQLGNLDTGVVEVMTILPTPQAGPVVVLAGDSTIEPRIEQPTSPPPTTPPLVLEPVDFSAEQANVRLIAGIAIGITALGFIWLAVSSRNRAGKRA